MNPIVRRVIASAARVMDRCPSIPSIPTLDRVCDNIRSASSDLDAYLHFGRGRYTEPRRVFYRRWILWGGPPPNRCEHVGSHVERVLGGAEREICDRCGWARWRDTPTQERRALEDDPILPG